MANTESSNDNKIKIKTPSTNESKSKRKMILLIGFVCALIIGLGSLTLGDPKPYVPPKRHSDFIDLTPGENKDWRTELQMQNEAIIRTNKEIDSKSEKSLELVNQALVEMRKNQDELFSLKREINILKKQKSVERVVMQEPRNGESNSKPESLKERIQRQMEEVNKAKQPNNSQTPQPKIEVPSISSTEKTRVLPPPPGMPYNKAKEFGEQTVETLKRPVNMKPDDSMMMFVAKEENYHPDSGLVATESVFKANEMAGFLPPGSLAKIALLSGLDSGTSEYTRANPQPVLMRVQSNATLPQGKYKIKSCFVLGSSYGDLSSERVFIQLSRITCVDQSQSMMLTGALSGFVTDSDSTQGLKGKVIRRNGALLGKSMLAGFASGLASVASTAGTTQVTTVTGAINSTLDTNRILETGGMEGIGTTMELIAKQYMDEAKNMFPVISVSGGRVGTMILTQGTKLEWKSYRGKYEEEVRPASLQKPLF